MPCQYVMMVDTDAKIGYRKLLDGVMNTILALENTDVGHTLNSPTRKTRIAILYLLPESMYNPVGSTDKLVTASK